MLDAPAFSWNAERACHGRRGNGAHPPAASSAAPPPAPREVVRRSAAHPHRERLAETAPRERIVRSVARVRRAEQRASRAVRSTGRVKADAIAGRLAPDSSGRSAAQQMSRGAIPEIDDLASLSLDLWAVEQAYERLDPSLADIWAVRIRPEGDPGSVQNADSQLRSDRCSRSESVIRIARGSALGLNSRSPGPFQVHPWPAAEPGNPEYLPL